MSDDMSKTTRRLQRKWGFWHRLACFAEKYQKRFARRERMAWDAMTAQFHAEADPAFDIEKIRREGPPES
jgi:hypothetical protein